MVSTICPSRHMSIRKNEKKSINTIHSRPMKRRKKKKRRKTMRRRVDSYQIDIRSGRRTRSEKSRST